MSSQIAQVAQIYLRFQIPQREGPTVNGRAFSLGLVLNSPYRKEE